MSRRLRIVAARLLGAGVGAALLALLAPLPARAAPAEMSRQEIICLAQSGVGFSYYWGHGSWCNSGCDPNFSCPAGTCTGSCPDCEHTGRYGADCSGFVAKVWQVPSPSEISDDTHPYSTQSFRCDTTHWTRIDKGDILAADALVYRNGGCPGTSGHVILYESGDPWGSSWTYEARGCDPGIVHNNRTVSSDYIAIRRDNLKADCEPSVEVCDGRDNDCDDEVDEGDVCGVEDENGAPDIAPDLNEPPPIEPPIEPPLEPSVESPGEDFVEADGVEPLPWDGQSPELLLDAEAPETGTGAHALASGCSCALPL